jgi:hypothetical protein
MVRRTFASVLEPLRVGAHHPYNLPFPEVESSPLLLKCKGDTNIQLEPLSQSVIEKRCKVL